MGHCLQLLIGHRAAIRAVVARVPTVRAFTLMPAATLLVVPLTDQVHEDLHVAYGTGEWLDFATESGFRLTTTDMDFCAQVSAGSGIAWISTEYFGGPGEQIAAVWLNGQLQMKPTLLRLGETRPLTLRPINTALRLLDVRVPAGTAVDEFDAEGLGHYRQNDDIIAEAQGVVF